MRECVIQTGESQVHVREKSNRNDHPQIDVYFRSIGWKNPERIAANSKPYCAAFVAWVLKQCKVPLPNVNLAAVASFDAMKSRRLKPGEAPMPADVVTYRTWSHTEFVKNWPLDPRIRVFYTVGANTTAGNNQQGVYANIPRPKAIVRNTIRFIPTI